jgi:hypothetical protein
MRSKARERWAVGQPAHSAAAAHETVGQLGRRPTGAVIPVVAATLLVSGCGSKGEPSGKALGEIASSKPGLLAPPKPPPEPTAVPASSVMFPVARRPANAGDIVLTEARRAAIEQAYPEARGFIDVSEVEQKLFALDLARGKLAEAVAEFDRHTARKWVLFTGAVMEPRPGGPELPVRYTPRDARDPLGVTSTWFSVKLDDVRGWDPDEYKPGELGVILAKYRGRKLASPGYDLILLDRWFKK